MNPIRIRATTYNQGVRDASPVPGPDHGNTNFFSPALQGGFDWSQNGFYLGNWNSNIGFTNAGIEMDFYGGYKGEIAKDLGYDVGILSTTTRRRTSRSTSTRPRSTAR